MAQLLNKNSNIFHCIALSEKMHEGQSKSHKLACQLIDCTMLFQFRHHIKRGLQKTPCCKHRIKTASRQPDDDVIDKTHHQMYASTASITNNGIQLSLEQTLAPSTSGSATSSGGSTSSTGTNSSDTPAPPSKVLNNTYYLRPQQNPPPPYIHQNRFPHHPPPASLPASVRATPTADFELYPRHLRTNSYTQATQHFLPGTAPLHRRFAVEQPQQAQAFQLRQLSDSCTSIQQGKQLLYDKLHGRQSSSSAGYYAHTLINMVKGSNPFLNSGW